MEEVNELQAPIKREHGRAFHRDHLTPHIDTEKKVHQHHSKNERKTTRFRMAIAQRRKNETQLEIEAETTRR